MATTYLQLVNDTCGRVNETPLTSANFSSAGGVYSSIKEAVNASIQYLNQEQFEWPFNHNTYDETLTAGDNRYSYQTGTKSIDYDTFRIQRNASLGTDTVWLKEITYEEYVQRGGIDAEYNTSDTGIRSVPRFVAQAPSEEYVIFPPPDQAYTLTYEYYAVPTDLSAYDDTMAPPDMFRHVIVDGAVYYLYFFRGDIETADRVFQKYQEGIKNLRTIYTNRYDYLRDTRIIRRPVTYREFVDE